MKKMTSKEVPVAHNSKETVLRFDPSYKLEKFVGLKKQGIKLFESEKRVGSRKGDTVVKRNIVLDARYYEMIENFPPPEKLKEYLRCGYCKKPAEPPTYLCKQGHLICGKDMLSTNVCRDIWIKSSCEMPFTSARPLWYEYLYNFSFLGMDKAAHENSRNVGTEKKMVKPLIAAQQMSTSEVKADSPLRKRRTMAAVMGPPPLQAQHEEKVVEIDRNKLANLVFRLETTKKPVKNKTMRNKPSDFRLTEEDVEFLTTNLNRLDENGWEFMIPSVKELNGDVPIEDIREQLQKLRDIIQDAYANMK